MMMNMHYVLGYVPSWFGTWTLTFMGNLFTPLREVCCRAHCVQGLANYTTSDPRIVL